MDEHRGKARNGARDQVHVARGDEPEKDGRTGAAQLLAAQEGSPEEAGPCCFCRKGHDIYHCARFFALTPGARRQAVDKSQGCYLCLKTGHFILECPSKLKCRFCGGKHNSSIHLVPAEDPTTQEGIAFSGSEEKQNLRSRSMKQQEEAHKPSGKGAPDSSIPKLPMEKAVSELVPKVARRSES